MTSSRALGTVLFTDFVSSTELEVRLGDQAFRRLLERHDALARRQVARFGGRFVKSTGDGVLAVFDLPTHALRCAVAMRDGAAALELELRCGIHTREIEQLADGDISGINVNVAAVSNLVCELLIGLAPIGKSQERGGICGDSTE